MDQHRAPLVDALAEYHALDRYGFTPPGHRQGRGADPRVIEVMGPEPFRADVLASAGLDDRSSSHGYLKEAEELMADAVGAEHAFFSTCGSSLSVKSAMLAVAGPKGGQQVSLPAGVVASTAPPVAWRKPNRRQVHANLFWVASRATRGGDAAHGLGTSRAPVARQCRMVGRMAFSIVRPEELQWITRPHEPREPARHVAELQSELGFRRSRANVWRYEPGARGRRHVHREQEETFVVLAGRLTMFLGEPPERHEVPVGGVVHVRAGTPLQTVNEGDEDLIVYAYGSPPDEGAEILPPAV